MCIRDSICIYDGAPDYPTPDRMWEFCAKHKVEILGISPTLVRVLAAHEESSFVDVSNHPANEAPIPSEIQNPKSKIQNRDDSPPSEGGVAAASADTGVPDRAGDLPQSRKAVK